MKTKIVRLDPKLHKRAKAKAALEDKSLFEAMNELVKQWLDNSTTTDETPQDEDSAK